MGATFPALCRALIRAPPARTGTSGWIYGVNTLGAAAGALAGLVLAERLGLRGASLAGERGELRRRVRAWRLSRAEGGARASSDLPAAESIDASAARRHGGRAPALRLRTLGCEILWFRGLRPRRGEQLRSRSCCSRSVRARPRLARARAAFTARQARADRPHPGARRCPRAPGDRVAGLGALGARALPPPLRLRARGPQSPWTLRIALDVAVAVATLLPATVVMGMSFPLATPLPRRRAARRRARGHRVPPRERRLDRRRIGGALLLLRPSRRRRDGVCARRST
jgi:hypothetical protein